MARMKAIKVLAIIGLVAGAGAATAVVNTSVVINTHLVLVACIGLVATAPILMRIKQGRLDIFEPLILTSGALLLFFVARPVYDIIVEDYHFLGRNLRDTYGTALLAALVAAVAFQVAYHTPLPAKLARRMPKAPEALHHDTLIAAALGLTVVAALFMLWAAAQRGGIATLAGDRSADTARVAPMVAQGFMLSIPAILLFLMVKTRYYVLFRTLALWPIGIMLIMAVPGGNRRFFLALVLSLVVFYFVRKAKRPSLFVASIACVVLLVMLVAPARASRNGEVSYQSALTTSLSQPLEAVGSVLESQDTSMIDQLALEIAVLGDGVPFRRGLQFVTDTVLLPIPGEVWAGKPEKVRTLIIDYYYGTNTGDCITQCPTFGLVGDLYADFGLASVALGSALLGILFAAAYHYFRLYSGNPIVQAGYSAGLWVSFYVWWSGFAFVTMFAILLVGPIVITAMLAGRQKTEPVSGRLQPGATAA